MCIRDNRFRLLVRVNLDHRLEQLLENIFGRVGGEEAVSGVDIGFVLLQVQVDVVFTLFRSGSVVSSVAVHLVSKDDGTAWVCSVVLLGSLLALVISLSSLLVLLVSPLELLTNFISRGILTLLDPGVCDDIRNG